ncbi:hypothetical protein [Sphingomonas sp. HMP6]|uniref:hypothetical protein n=1 Tax=Sphingomonas sp. HMP6 TaxID=1517551 RepID=UPI0015969715|nr:hypothetical protein [Sphingomonas sp. HMP6]BCA57960.1 hypothetical protein HMP06_0729 [Sphingomonas sp. HMP6]
MKFMMFAALTAAVATPALAQTMPAPAQDPAMTQPAPPAQPADPAMAPTPPATPMTTPDANMSGAAPAAPMPATGSYPMCSRTVVDQCTERSNARGERLHSTPRPPRKR